MRIVFTLLFSLKASLGLCTAVEVGHEVSEYKQAIWTQHIDVDAAPVETPMNKLGFMATNLFTEHHPSFSNSLNEFLGLPRSKTDEATKLPPTFYGFATGIRSAKLKRCSTAEELPTFIYESPIYPYLIAMRSFFEDDEHELLDRLNRAVITGIDCSDNPSWKKVSF